MANDKSCKISSALQTKQGSRGQVKQSRGFELAQTTGVAQPGRPGSPLIPESPMAFPALSTEGQNKAWQEFSGGPSPPAIIEYTEYTSNWRPQEEETDAQRDEEDACPKAQVLKERSSGAVSRHQASFT